MSDLISRQAVIDEIEERKNANGYSNVVLISELNRLEGYIIRLPSAERTGRWINHRCDDGHHIADCDQCGHALQWFDDDEPKFCCECGARMEEPEDIPMEYFENGGR